VLAALGREDEEPMKSCGCEVNEVCEACAPDDVLRRWEEDGEGADDARMRRDGECA
jgi:hypothetical protein